MAKLHSLLGFTAICTALAMATLSSCTVGDGDDDDDGGAGGESADGGSKPSGGTTTGGTGGAGGSGGKQAGGDGPGGAGGAGGDGGAAPGGAGAGGAGAGGTSGRVCEGEGGAVAAEGVSCAEYCSEFFDRCAAFAEDAAFENEAACRRSCEFFLNEQLCCRAFHVILAGESGAGGGANAECAQAAGTETCN
jgi:hypothetical protein